MKFHGKLLSLKMPNMGDASAGSTLESQQSDINTYDSEEQSFIMILVAHLGHNNN